MVTTFWTQGGNIVTDGSGKPILCDHCPCVARSGLYMAGDFTTAGSATNRIAFWDGSDWADVGGGVDGTVYALRNFGTGLIACGSMSNNFSVWNGNSWSTSLGTPNSTVNDATDMGDTGGLTLFIVGFFTSVSGTSTPNGIALWYNGTWYDASSGFTGTPDSIITTPGGDVYCGSRNGKVYKLTGGFPGSLSWSLVGVTAKLTQVNSLLWYSSSIYNAGPAVSTGQPVNNYNGSVWVSHGPGDGAAASALCNGSGTLCAVLDRGGGGGASTVEYLDTGTTWVSLSNTHQPRGIAGSFVGRDMVLFPGSSRLVYGADLASDGTTRIGMYNSSFAALGSQPNDKVRTLLVVP